MRQEAIVELKKTGIDSAELDATILLCEVLKKDKIFLLTHPELKLTRAQLFNFKKKINRRMNNEPIAYITGHKEFYKYDFVITPDVLIPRPESEELVSLALGRILKLESRIKNNPKLSASRFQILDLGTGSGCLAISIAKAIEELGIKNKKLGMFASDISKQALSIAKKNAGRLLGNNGTIEQYNNLHFFHSDLFSNRKLHKMFDLIIANLPYVPKQELRIKDEELRNCHFDSPTLRSGAEKSFCNCKISRLSSIARDDKLNSVSFEPATAIFAEENGTAIIKRFLDEVSPFLQQTSLLLLEVDPRNAKELLSYSKKIFQSGEIELKKDLAGLDRYLIIQK